MLTSPILFIKRAHIFSLGRLHTFYSLYVFLLKVSLRERKVVRLVFQDEKWHDYGINRVTHVVDGLGLVGGSCRVGRSSGGRGDSIASGVCLSHRGVPWDRA